MGVSFHRAHVGHSLSTKGCIVNRLGKYSSVLALGCFLYSKDMQYIHISFDIYVCVHGRKSQSRMCLPPSLHEISCIYIYRYLKICLYIYIHTFTCIYIYMYISKNNNIYIYDTRLPSLYLHPLNQKP